MSPDDQSPGGGMTYKCCRCDATWTGAQKPARKLGWRFMGVSKVWGYLAYCPDHKQFQYSLADRDV